MKTSSGLAATALLLGFGVSPTALAQPAPPPPPEVPARATEITLEELWRDYKYIPERVPGFNFSAGSSKYTRIDQARVVEADFATGDETGVIFDFDALRAANEALGLAEGFDGYVFSEDERKVLITTKQRPIYRRSSTGDYLVYDRDAGTVTPLDPEGRQMNPVFSPDGGKVAYVRDRDIYVRDLGSGAVTRVTSDGAPNAVINGATDWVYEEEFAIVQGMAWSPDGASLLYLRFDESAVPEFTMEMYDAAEMYPEYRTWKYPKVGEANATVSAHVWRASANTGNLRAGLTQEQMFERGIKTQPSYDAEGARDGSSRQLFTTGDGDTHVPRFYWTPAGEPMLWVTNRHQDTLSLLVERQPGGPLETLLTEGRDTYLDVHDDLRLLDDGSFLWTSDADGYNHVYHYGRDGGLLRQLTKGNYPVTEFYGYDEATRTLYFQAAKESPLRREVYRMSLNGGEPQRMSKEAGWNDAVFSADFSGYMLQHSTANRPPTYAIYDRDGELVRSLVDNAAAAETAREEGFRPVEFWSFSNEVGDELNGWRITPAGFRESGTIAYPLFMFQYSGPGSQQVVDRWGGQNTWWFQMLAQQGYVVACVDGRGTGARGADFQKQTYLQLGKFETEDQIAAARYLGSQLYIDASRIGIFGWSYGGYMSSLAITKGADVFSLAIAVAPVTNWKWYDTLYTERYMRTTKENADGYADNSPINFAGLLEGDYLLVHGLGDDNVHAQHSIEMANALIAADKDFDFEVYPNRNHGIYGGVTRLHLYRRMTAFINENL